MNFIARFPHFYDLPAWAVSPVQEDIIFNDGYQDLGILTLEYAE